MLSMTEAALRSVLGRCPACEQLVTLPGDARFRPVSCPACQHRAQGMDFGDLAPPLPVILLATESTNGLTQSHPADEARTHLLLDPPCEDEDAEDAQTPARLRIPAPGSASRSGHCDDERTHLLLDASDLHEEPEPAAPLSPRRRPRAPAAAAHTEPAAATDDDERTRLMLGHVSVRAQPPTLFLRALAQLSRVLPATLRLSVWLDETLHDRWLWALGASAVLCGFVAPGLDYLASRSATTLGAITWLITLLDLGVLALARLNALRNDAGLWDPRVLLARARTQFALLVESFEQLAGSPRHLRLALTGQLAAMVGLAGFAWAGFLAGVRTLFDLDGSASCLPLLSGSVLLGGVFLLQRAARTAPAPGLFLQDFGNCLAAALELPPLVDLAEPLPEAFARGATVFHESVVALATWQPRSWPDEVAYRCALERHLQRQLPGAKIEHERWMGPSRLDGVLDLVINGMIVVGVQRGFGPASAQRAIGQMSGYARAWAGKPMILAVFEAPREALLDSPDAQPLIDAHHDSGLLTVRMPTD
jgi:hypothetical protein